MSEGPTFQAPPPQPETQPGQEPPKSRSERQPPWGSDEEFNPAKAWERIEKQSRDIDSLRVKATEYDKIVEAQKTEQQKAADARRAAEDRAVQAESEASRLRVALTKGLPADLATRLVGSTEEELAADADRLLELVRVAPPTPSFDGGTRQTAPVHDMNASIRRAAGRT